MIKTARWIIDKRKRLWEKHRNLDIDGEYREAVARELMSDAGLRKEVKSHPALLVEMVFLIVDKKKDTVPFFFNDVQRDFVSVLEARGGGKPYFVLKGRQQGFTSVITAIQLAYSITAKNFSGYTMADCPDNVRSIFNDKAKTVYNRLPESLKPTEKYNSRTELYFSKLNSSWRISAAGEDTGRSKTLNFLHLSEVAFFKVELSAVQKSIGEALTSDAIVVYETTANGFNQAKELWDSKTCHNLFYEWWRTSEYSLNDLSVIDGAKDSWILARIEWLRAHGVREEQIAWYVTKYDSYLDKDSIRQEYPCYPEEAFLSSGRCYFDKELVYERINDLREAEYVNGSFTYDYDGLHIGNIRFAEDSQGFIRIYKKPEENVPYVIGGDTAGDGSDYFAAHVIDNTTGEEVAVLHNRTGEELYARQIYCLGMYYNKALVGLEINFSSYPQKELVRLDYPRIYLRDKEDVIGGGLEPKYGFKTTSATRPVILAELAKVVREEIRTINDIATLKEMITFIRTDTGRPQADIGAHDDLVMSLAIAHYIRPQQAFVRKTPKNEKVCRAVYYNRGHWVINPDAKT